MSSKYQKEANELKNTLWQLANDLRGQMNAFQFGKYIMALLCFRYLSEMYETYYKDLVLEDHQDKEKNQENRKNVQDKEKNQENRKNVQDQEVDEFWKEAKEEIIQNSKATRYYYIAPEFWWTRLIQKLKDEKFDTRDLSSAFEEIYNSSQDLQKDSDNKVSWADIFKNINLQPLGDNDKKRISKLKNIMYAIHEFCPYHNGIEMLGEVYEYLMEQFASNTGKKAGEFFTPVKTSDLVSQLAIQSFDKEHAIDHVYDPACGSGSLLLRTVQAIELRDGLIKKEEDGRFSRIKGKKGFKGNIYGQESSEETYQLAHINMILHDRKPQNIYLANANTITDPRHKDMKFDIIVMNPPYGLKNKTLTEDLKKPHIKKDDRFENYNLPTKNADYAFLLHALHHLKEDGTSVIIIPPGVLFITDKNAKNIRQQLINNHILHTIILLPHNLFFATETYAYIVVMSKNKPYKDVFFIDARSDFVPEKNRNSLNDKHIENIVKTFKKRENVDGYATLVTVEEIQKNDYNLSIHKYVMRKKFEPPVVDVDCLLTEIQELEKQEIDEFSVSKLKHLLIEK
ncbi:type I restriction-modification system subunit M [Candidatus Phytoplasma meliae]|uniref:site-specific DNA-methyltransferase (adenine-specific) n=1 Tax=Candidatus Phytoplasma meliae TaxID=1848402 RepID=A0ABS5CYE8_9MOLU|nr:type I restriction-modification system subunit M [Candidatus Phytoplasma meliae]MBP5835995.1 type I restriction-modification system subunit M [Candidatus Phytoplasma meliae]